MYALWAEDDQRFSFSITDNGGKKITAAQHKELLKAVERGEKLQLGQGGDPVAIAPVISLDDQKQGLFLLLDQETEDRIQAGYTSDALGTTHTYPSNRDYQTNILGAKLAGVAMPFMCADESGNWDRRPHTATQLAQVFADAVLRKSAIYDAKDVLVTGIRDAEDQAAFDDIDINTGWPE